jgi:cellulose biosynthesis protein BcsQ
LPAFFSLKHENGFSLMHVIVIASQKGGSGKTTLTGNLAIAAERAEKTPAVLIFASATAAARAGRLMHTEKGSQSISSVQPDDWEHKERSLCLS